MKEFVWEYSVNLSDGSINIKKFEVSKYENNIVELKNKGMSVGSYIQREIVKGEYKYSEINNYDDNILIG